MTKLISNADLKNKYGKDVFYLVKDEYLVTGNYDVDANYFCSEDYLEEQKREWRLREVVADERYFSWEIRDELRVIDEQLEELATYVILGDKVHYMYGLDETNEEVNDFAHDDVVEVIEECDKFSLVKIK